MRRPGRSATVLVVSPSEADHAALTEILRAPQRTVVCVRSGVEAWILLHGTTVDVIITDSELPGGQSWKDLLAEIAAMRQGHRTIVASAIIDSTLEEECLRLGAHQLLQKPFVPSQVLAAVESAYPPDGSRRPRVSRALPRK